MLDPIAGDDLERMIMETRSNVIYTDGDGPHVFNATALRYCSALCFSTLQKHFFSMINGYDWLRYVILTNAKKIIE